MLNDFVERMRALTLRVSRDLNRPDLASMHALREKLALDEERVRKDVAARSESKEFLGKIPDFWCKLQARQKAYAGSLKSLVADEVARLKALSARITSALGQRDPLVSSSVALEQDVLSALERGRETAFFILETETFYTNQSSIWRTTQSMVQFALCREGTAALNSSLMQFAATRVTELQDLAGEPEVAGRGLNLMMDDLAQMLAAVAYQRQFAAMSKELKECIERLERAALQLYESEQVSVDSCKELQQPLVRVVQLEETLRRRNLRAFQKRFDKNLLVVIEQEMLLLNSVFGRCNGAYQVVFDALGRLTNDTVQELLLTNELAGDNVKSRARELLIAILWNLERLLAQDAALREELLYLRQCSQCLCSQEASPSAIESAGALVSVRVSSIQKDLEQLQALVSDFKVLRRRLYPVMESSGILDAAAPEPIAAASQSPLPAGFLARMEAPLSRLEHILERYEKFLGLSVSSPDGAGAPAEFESVWQRDEVRTALSEAIEAQRQLWSLINHSTADDRKLLELWSQRTQYAKLLGDEKLVQRAAKRKEAYEKLLLSYRFILSVDAPSEIPLFVLSATAVAERIEAKCGFELHPAVAQNSVLLAMSALDRCIFLVESLDSYAAAALSVKESDRQR